jgi:hypothetical protein
LCREALPREALARRNASCKEKPVVNFIENNSLP